MRACLYLATRPAHIGPVIAVRVDLAQRFLHSTAHAVIDIRPGDHQIEQVAGHRVPCGPTAAAIYGFGPCVNVISNSQDRWVGGMCSPEGGSSLNVKIGG